MSSERSSAIRIAFFNHKGGVGKTTLTVNVAHALNLLGKRVLLVDADPQCNLTAYYLSPEKLDQYLDAAEEDEGTTLWSALKPLSDSNGELKSIRAIRLKHLLYLIHGDLKLSIFEQDLTTAWTECFQRKIRGLSTTGAISKIVTRASNKFDIDFVFFDVGPNIGPLNRAILLDCDYFIIPTACDLFSLRALTTLGRTLISWITDWRVISSIAPKSKSMLPGRPRFLGYIPQRFRVYRGVVTSGQSAIVAQIGRSIGSEIVNVMRSSDPSLAESASTDFKLGEVKDFGQAASVSQEEGVAIEDCTSASQEQRELAHDIFEGIAKRIIKLAR
jgi:cellulose biosynthesis protein BcsQ